MKRNEWWAWVAIGAIAGNLLVEARPWLTGAYDAVLTLACIGWWHATRSYWPLVVLFIAGATSVPDLYHDARVHNAIGAIGALTWIGVGVWATSTFWREEKERRNANDGS